MKKVLIIFLVLLAIPSYLYLKKNTAFLDMAVPRLQLFSKGTDNQIRKYLDEADHHVTLNDYFNLIGDGRYDMLELVLKEYGDHPNFPDHKIASPLTYAAQELRKPAVELLVKYGADLDYKDENGNTALIYATKATFALRSFKYSSQQITKILIEAGADVNAVGKWFTPLEGAIYSKDMVNVKYIVENGGDVNYLDSDGASYLFGCFSLECITLFLSKGLDINAVNNRGQSFIQGAARGRIEKVEEFEKLIEFGADICHKDNEDLNILNYIEEAGMNPHWKTDNPEFYQKKLAEHRATEVYKYLEKEYTEKCFSKAIE